jgi:hypothetical protein
MDVVELVEELPGIFSIVDFEVAVGLDANSELGWMYHCGWMGLRYIPVTFANGNLEAWIVAGRLDVEIV